MADIQANKGPDNYQNHQERPIIKTAESLGVGPQMGEVVYKTQKGVAAIFVKGEAKKETGELNEVLKKEFIEKLKKQTKNQDILYAIEKGTLKIFNIPGKDKFAISLNGNNLDYIFNKDGTQYFELVNRRQDNIKYAIFQSILKDIGLEEINNNGNFVLRKQGKELTIFSNEYFLAIISAIDKSLEYANILRSLKDKK